jgi:fimbrial chaperone protein
VGLRRIALGILASAAVLGLSPARSDAGSFSISPLRVELSAAAQTGVLTVRNPESGPVVVQAEAMLWEQADGEDRLTPTRDVLVSPVIFTLPPQGSQLVRVALRRPAEATRQLSYRLILTEVPQPASPDFAGLNMSLRISLPVFVQPAVEAKPRLAWTASRDPKGGVVLTASNSGTAHERVYSFVASTDGAASTGAEQNVAAYLLPGQSRSWTLAATEVGTTVGSDTRLRIRGRAESGDFEVETPIAGP